MSAVDRFLEKLVEQIQLGGGRLVPAFIDAEQAQIATDLAQPEQTGEHLHPLRAGVHILAGTAETLLDLAQERVVGRALRGSLGRTERPARFSPADLSRRRVSAGAGGTGCKPAREPALHVGRGARARSAVRSARGNRSRSRDNPGATKFMIDQRSRTEFSIGVPVRTKRWRRAEDEGGLRVLRLGIFDVLRFVEHGGGELDCAQMLDVATEQTRSS